MNTVTIEGVNINIDEAAKHESLDSLKGLDLFADGPKKDASYEELWKAVSEHQAKPVEVKVSVKKGKK